MVHFHLKFELINAVIWYPKMFSGIDASVAVAPVVNPTSIISLFLSDVITFFISWKIIFKSIKNIWNLCIQQNGFSWKHVNMEPIWVNLAKWLSVCLLTNWFCYRIPLLSLISSSLILSSCESDSFTFTLLFCAAFIVTFDSTSK